MLKSCCKKYKNIISTKGWHRYTGDNQDKRMEMNLFMMLR